MWASVAIGGNVSGATSTTQGEFVYWKRRADQGGRPHRRACGWSNLLQSSPTARRNFAKSAVSGNFIDLGANHGIQTGDLVTYHDANGIAGRIGGLSQSETYIAVVDSGNPNRISLQTSASPHNTVTLNGAVGDASGHYFDLINPRRVKLATSFPECGCGDGHQPDGAVGRMVRINNWFRGSNTTRRR